MTRATLLAGLALGTLLSSAALSPAFADDPLSPSYKTPQQKAYFMMFMEMDKDSNGVITMEEYMGVKDPLNPKYQQNPEYAKKLEAWREMDKAAKGEITMEAFVAYMDAHDPLSPSYKKK